MVVSSRGGGAADTRATAPPLTKPSQPTRLVAVRSRGGLWEKNLGVFGAVAWGLAGSTTGSTPISSPACGRLGHGSLDAVVDAIAHVDIKPPRFPKQGVVAGRAASMPVAGGVVLGIRLRFHNHGLQQLT